MRRITLGKPLKIVVGLFALLALGLFSIGGMSLLSRAADEKAPPPAAGADAKAPEGGECYKAGDTTPPMELVAKIPPGGLHSPYQDYTKLAKEQELVKQFRPAGLQ